MTENIRCANCALEGMSNCPICYIEKQTLCFVNHSPEWYCADFESKETEGNE